MSRGRRMSGPLRLGDLMGATLGSAKLTYGIRRARAILLWPQAVGPDIARMTRPRTQQGTTLFVEVRDSATAHHLSMQRHHFLKALNALLPDAPLTEIRFSVGTVREPTPPAAVSPLPAPDRARARQLVQDVPDDLKSAALRAAEAITRARKWREEQGWRPCPVCGEASREQPCRACTLTLDDPNVRRAARTLMRQPERLEALRDTIGNSGVHAARHLALRQLEDQLNLLALECVRSGHDDGYREFLEQQARVFLALTLGRPRAGLRRADFTALPDGARSVLSAGRGSGDA
ncbi:DciA family protein [Deinococcus taeanensis]|uniref:DciA family protein n=1 Tax=Deinococcus taeanensis TaxID=2737050 RepID=UPI001CDD5B22|nr:DciA family protein [Deinococcus taeanensis]UBV41482.1 DciA family protein [Deinococcus taeanensis]